MSLKNMASEEFEFMDFSNLDGQEYQHLVKLVGKKECDLTVKTLELDEVIQPIFQKEGREVSFSSEFCKDLNLIDKDDTGTADITFFVDGGCADDAIGTPPMLVFESSRSMSTSPACIEHDEIDSTDEKINVYESRPNELQSQYVPQPTMEHNLVHSVSSTGVTVPVPPLANGPPHYLYPPYNPAPISNSHYSPYPPGHAMLNPTVYVENCQVNFAPFGSPQTGPPLYPTQPHYQNQQHLYQPYVLADQNIPQMPVKNPHEKMEYDHKRYDHQNRGNSRGRSHGRGRARGRDAHERSNSVSSDHSSYSDSGIQLPYQENSQTPKPYSTMYHSGYQPFPGNYPITAIPRHGPIPMFSHNSYLPDPYLPQPPLRVYHPPTPASVSQPIHHDPSPSSQTECNQFNEAQETTISTHTTYISTSVVTQDAAPNSNYCEIDEGIYVDGQNNSLVDEQLTFGEVPPQDYYSPNGVTDNKDLKSIVAPSILESNIKNISKEDVYSSGEIIKPKINQAEIPINSLPSEVKIISCLTEQEATKNQLNNKKSSECAAATYNSTTILEHPLSPTVFQMAETRSNFKGLPRENALNPSNLENKNNTKVIAEEKEETNTSLPNVTKIIHKNNKGNISPSVTDETLACQGPNDHSFKKECKETDAVMKKRKSLLNNNHAVHQYVTLPTEASSNSVIEEAAPPSVWDQKKPWSQLFRANEESSVKQIAYVFPFNAQVDDVKNSERNSAEKLSCFETAQSLDLTEEKSKVGVVLSSFEPNYRPVQLQPRGLINKNYWCYVNAPLQALLACPSMYQAMKTLSKVSGYKSSNVSTPFINSLVDFFNDFSMMPQLSKSRKEKAKVETEISIGTSFEPTCVYKMLINCKENQFTEGRQQDAEEMLSCVLNGLHDEMVEAMKLANGNSVETNGDTENTSDDDDEWKVQGPRKKSCVTRTAHFNPSPISQIFWGRQRSVFQKNGGNTTANLQPFNSLPLDIQSSKVNTLKEALSQLVTREEISGFTCPKTNQETAASTQVMLEDLPRVLILQLKRFIYDKDGGLQKVTKRLQFPIDLEITKDLLSVNSRGKFSPSQRKYRLFAIVNHEGKEATKGHYVADVYHTGYNCWIRYDDSNVKAIPEQTVLRHEPPRVPYLLFYRRSDTLLVSSKSSVSSNINNGKKQAKS